MKKNIKLFEKLIETIDKDVVKFNLKGKMIPSNITDKHIEQLKKKVDLKELGPFFNKFIKTNNYLELIKEYAGPGYNIVQKDKTYTIRKNKEEGEKNNKKNKNIKNNKNKNFFDMADSLKSDEKKILEALANNGCNFDRNKEKELRSDKIYKDGNVLSDQKKKLCFIPILVLYGQKVLGISDLHIEVVGKKTMRFRGRKDQKLKSLRIDQLLEVLEAEKEKFANFFFGRLNGDKKIKESIGLLISMTKNNDFLEFDLLDPKARTYAYYLIKGFYTLAKDNFSSVEKKNVSANVHLHIFPEKDSEKSKLEYRQEFTHTPAVKKDFYSMVSRLLITKVIKPDYKDYSNKIEDNLSNVGLNFFIGSTNSGKSSSVLSQLQTLNDRDPDKAYHSIEKPIEKTLDFVRHCSIEDEGNDKLSYLEHLKSELRSDGDVIFLGEIREKDELVKANQFARVGNILFSTFHANSVLSLKGRIEDWMPLKDSLGIINNLICQSLETRYSKEYLIRIKNIDNKKDLHKELLEKNRTIGGLFKVLNGEPSPTFRSFWLKNKKFKPAVENNLLVKKEIKKDWLEAVDDIKTYAQYIADNFCLPINRNPDKQIETSGMQLLFEYLEVDDYYVKAAQENREIEDYVLTEKNTTFIPAFINTQLYHGKEIERKDKTIAFPSIKLLASAYKL